MDLLLHEIDKCEVLRYLGYRDNLPDSLVAAQLDAACATLLRLARPQALYRLFDLKRQDNGYMLCGTTVTLLGADICTHLQDARQCALMAVTLGAAMDLELRRVQVKNVAQAFVLNAVASTAVEQVCDTLCGHIQEAAGEGQWLTPRFSPGYGDMPLAQQKHLCALLDVAKIGISHTAHHLLLPSKSITAVLGLVSHPMAQESTPCASCKLFEACEQRKGNIFCGKPAVQ